MIALPVLYSYSSTASDNLLESFNSAGRLIEIISVVEPSPFAYSNCKQTPEPSQLRFSKCLTREVISRPLRSPWKFGGGGSLDFKYSLAIR